MFGSIGGAEILLIFVLALLLFGPRRLPEIGKTLGKMVAEFRKATTDFRTSLEREVEIEKLRDAQSGLRNLAREALPTLGSVGIPPIVDAPPPAPPPPPAPEAPDSDARREEDSGPGAAGDAASELKTRSTG